MTRFNTKTIIFWAYFAAVFIISHLKFWQPTGSFIVTAVINLCLMFGAAFLSRYFFVLDQLIDIVFTNPQSSLALAVAPLLSLKQYKQTLILLGQRNKELTKLALKSVLFQVAWVVLAFFILTSTAGIFGKTLVMAIGLHLLLTEWEDFMDKKDMGWLFWQIKRTLGIKEQKYYLYLMTGIFIILSLMLV